MYRCVESSVIVTTSREGLLHEMINSGDLCAHVRAEQSPSPIQSIQVSRVSLKVTRFPYEENNLNFSFLL